MIGEKHALDTPQVELGRSSFPTLDKGVELQDRCGLANAEVCGNR